MLPVAGVFLRRPGGQPDAVEGGEQPVAGRVAGEHPAGAVAAVRGRGEADDQHRGVGAPSRRSGGPSRAGREGRRLSGDVLAPGDQPRTGAADRHRGVEPVEVVGGGQTSYVALPAETDAAVVVAQHRKADAVEGGLAGLLGHRAHLPVADANDKTSIEPGHVYLAPPDYHLLVQPGYFSLSTDDRVHFARPSIDVLFESAADAYRERLVGVILTGANADGAAGLARIKRAGGVAVVQDP